MTVRKILDKYYEGLEADPKPTGAIPTSIFRETDTQALYVTYDGDNWIVADQRVRLVGEDGSFLALDEWFGPAVVGRAITATLRVSPDGDGTDGSSLAKAYQTIEDALDAASIDSNAMTLILISPNNGSNYYDINRTGTPTWAANVRLQGTMRNFAQIRNTHASAACIMKLTGLAVLSDIGIHLHTGDNDGIIMTDGGSRTLRCLFDGSELTGAAIALWLDGVAQAGHHSDGCDFQGHVTHMRGILIDSFAESHLHNCQFHECLTAIQIVGSDSDDNHFHDVTIRDCALGIDIDAGNDQHFRDIYFHGNTRDVDDEVGDHEWIDIHGGRVVALYPDNFTGTSVDPAAGADTWGGDTELIAAGVIDNPFRVVAIHVEGSAAEKFRVRFSADGGATHYDDVMFEGAVNEVKRESTAFGTADVPIFNKGTRISASAKSESGSNTGKVWVEIIEI